MYAIIETGGKQYRVEEGSKIVVEKLAGEAGSEIKLDKVLMLGGRRRESGRSLCGKRCRDRRSGGTGPRRQGHGVQALAS